MIKVKSNNYKYLGPKYTYTLEVNNKIIYSNKINI